MSGSEASLAECIADGSVPKPDLGDWNTWLVWRKGAGRRPKVSLGDRLSTSSRQESDLWKATMQRLYGADWRTQLEEAQLAAADAEDAAGPLPRGHQLLVTHQRLVARASRGHQLLVVRQ